VAAAPAVAAAAGGDGTPYPGDLGQAVATLVIFALLLVVLGKWAWKPILAQLEHREQDIAHRVEQAEQHQARADELAAEYEQKLSDYQARHEEMLAQARRDAAEAGEELLAKARAEARDVTRRAQEDIASAQDRARDELRQQTAEMAARIARQVLAEDLDETRQQELLRKAARQIAERRKQEAPV
jgi:F-type H+-transporting ATPase subunit b